MKAALQMRVYICHSFCGRGRSLRVILLLCLAVVLRWVHSSSEEIYVCERDNRVLTSDEDGLHLAVVQRAEDPPSKDESSYPRPSVSSWPRATLSTIEGRSVLAAMRVARIKKTTFRQQFHGSRPCHQGHDLENARIVLSEQRSKMPNSSRELNS